MTEILTEVDIKKHLIVGPGWIDLFNGIDFNCELCGKLLNKQDPYLINKKDDHVCKDCYDGH